MLIVLAHNDGTGTNEAANYNVEVRVNERIIWKGSIRKHDRRQGWPKLLKQIARKGETKQP